MPQSEFYVRRFHGRSPFYMSRDADGELGFTHVKRDASAFTEDEANIIAASLNRYTQDGDEVEVVTMGSAAP